MDLLEKLRLRAMAGVLEPDWDAKFRSIARWYSREFSTPLTQVYALPVDFVLLHYFEADYEGLEEEKLHEIAWELITPPEVLEHEAELEKKSDDDFFAATARKAASMKSLKDDQNKKVSAAVDTLGEQDPLEVKKAPVKMVPDGAGLKSLEPLEFSISEDKEFMDLMNSDPLSIMKKK